MKQKGLPVRQAGLAPILIVILIAVILVGSFYLGKQYQLAKNPNLYDNPSSLWPTSTNQSLKDWHIYVNPRFRFAFKYPRIGFINEGGYLPIDIQLNPGSYGALLNLYPDENKRSVENKLYDTGINISYYKTKENQGVKDFIDKINSFGEPGGEPYMQLLPRENYRSTAIDGREATIVDYVVTSEIAKKIKDAYGMKIKQLPEGYKTKIVFIKNRDFIYILEAGSLLYEEDENQFNQILSTFKFLP